MVCTYFGLCTDVCMQYFVFLPELCVFQCVWACSPYPPWLISGCSLKTIQRRNFQIGSLWLNPRIPLSWLEKKRRGRRLNTEVGFVFLWEKSAQTELKSVCFWGFLSVRHKEFEVIILHRAAPPWKTKKTDTGPSLLTPVRLMRDYFMISGCLNNKVSQNKSLSVGSFRKLNLRPVVSCLHQPDTKIWEETWCFCSHTRPKEKIEIWILQQRRKTRMFQKHYKPTVKYGDIIFGLHVWRNQQATTLRLFPYTVLWSFWDMRRFSGAAHPGTFH